MTKLALLGGKLGHSLSPRIHELFFQLTGLKGSYELWEKRVEELPGAMELLRAEYLGANVTIPHKLAVMPLLNGISPEAQAIGAVNTIKFTSEGVWGYNTDYFGFRQILSYNGIELKDKHVSVLGSGGAARAVVKAVVDSGARTISVVTRHPQELDRQFYTIAPENLQAVSYTALEESTGDVMVNCTPVGMYPKMDASPVSYELASIPEVCIDIIYNPARTLFLQAAEQAGHQAVNGLFMLVAQAVAAEEIWQETSYGHELIVAIMDKLRAEL